MIRSYELKKMIEFENKDRYIKGCIWIDEIPFRFAKQNKIKVRKEAGEVKWREGVICLEAKLNARHTSNYAMVCMRYLENQNDNTDIYINWGREETEFETRVFQFNRNVQGGLEREFADAIEAFFMEYPYKMLPPGTIEILGGCYDEIGSSNLSFTKVMKLLVFIFQNIDNLDENTLKSNVLNIIYERQSH